jgi:3-isopropylmalate/(R)-2-methylmalate dehydratase small subunit
MPVTVDLEARTVTFAGVVAAFEIDDYVRWRLLEGLDDIGITMQSADLIAGFESARPRFTPRTA